MSETTRWAALEVLESIEEALSGLVHLERRGALDKESQVAFVHTLVAAMTALDAYLTGSVEFRSNKDALAAAIVLGGMPWSAELSDGATRLVVRKPTKDDRRMTFFDERDAENLPDPETRARWDVLTAHKAAPSKFPVTDELFE